MKILVTGAKGFVGRNLCTALREIQKGNDRRPEHAICARPLDIVLCEYDVDCDVSDLDRYCANCDFVFHLAGVSRPEDPERFMEENCRLTAELLAGLKKHGNTCPVLLASSTQASLRGRFADSEYGKSKKAGEELLFAYGRETGARVLVYRFPNLFGKWCRPNYNSAIATFCHNAANGLPVEVSDPALELELVYIDDLVEEMIYALRGEATAAEDGYYAVPVCYRASLGWIADMVCSFPELRERLGTPNLADPLTRKLYSTYLTYLPEEDFVCDQTVKRDRRGSFTEILRTPERGQLSVNVSKAGMTRGEHWHHSKHERFIVVHGHGVIRMRKLDSDRLLEFEVSGERLQAVDVVPGWTHSIVNLSDTEDLVTLVWANEPFDPGKPDTFFEKV